MFRIKSIILIICLSSLATALQAQKSYREWGVHVRPSVNGSLLMSSGSGGISDSVRKSNTTRGALSFGLDYFIKKNNDAKIQIGLVYSDLGFRKERINLRFGDSIHEAIGIVADLSQTVRKDVYYDYRFRYVELPLIYHLNMSSRLSRRDLELWFSGGLHPSFLLKDELIVRLPGWSAAGNTKHVLSTSYHTVGSFNMGVSFGARVDYKAMKGVRVSVYPSYKLMFASVKRGNQSNMLGSLGIAFGLSFPVGGSATSSK